MFVSQNPREFFVSQEGFWFLHIFFVRIAKFQVLAQFSVDHLPHPVVSIIAII